MSADSQLNKLYHLLSDCQAGDLLKVIERSGSVPRLRRVDFNQTFTYNVIGWDIQHDYGITIGGMLMLSAESVIRPTASDEKMEEAPFSFLTNRKRRVTILW